MYEQEENLIDEEYPTLIIADLDWSSMPEDSTLLDPNLSNEIVKKLKGLDENSLAKEVELWQNNINLLPKYDEVSIRREISTWNIGIPGKDEFDFETYSLYYALQMQYRVRLSAIISVVFSHHELLFQAHKALKEMAIKVAPGSNKHDKEGIATFTVSNFTIALSHAKRLLTYLESVLKNIDFAATQMDRLIREHQAMARYNNSFTNEGMVNLIERSKPLNSINNTNNAEIKTRNRRLK